MTMNVKEFQLRKAQMYGGIWYINRQALFLITIKYQIILGRFHPFHRPRRPLGRVVV
jgi:hypothetical protein